MGFHLSMADWTHELFTPSKTPFSVNRGIFQKRHMTLWQGKQGGSNEWKTSTFWKKSKWEGEGWASRAEWDGLYLLRWLLTRSKSVCPSEPRRGSGEGVRIGAENWGWGRGESEMCMRKSPPQVLYLIQPSDYPYFSARDRSFSLWRNGGEAIFKELLIKVS